MSLNPFSARHLRPEIELMYLLRMRRHYRHKSPKMVSRARNGRGFLGQGLQRRLHSAPLVKRACFLLGVGAFRPKF